jgi:hypothetical protein
METTSIHTRRVWDTIKSDRQLTVRLITHPLNGSHQLPLKFLQSIWACVKFANTWLLHHNNAPSQCVVYEGVSDALEHHSSSAAPIFPRSVPCDILFFPVINNHLQVHHFNTTENMIAVTHALKDLTEKDFSNDFFIKSVSLLLCQTMYTGVHCHHIHIKTVQMILTWVIPVCHFNYSNSKHSLTHHSIYLFCTLYHSTPRSCQYTTGFGSAEPSCGTCINVKNTDP